MYWFYLAMAIVLEVAGTTCMKLSEGFTRTIPSVLVFVLYMVSFAFMILALDEPVPEEVAETIRSYDGMLDVWLVNLDPA